MPRRTSAAARALPFLVALAVLPPASAEAFVILNYRFEPCTFPCTPEVDLERSLREAPRWDAAPGARSTLADGIQVGVASGFAETMAADTGLDPALLERGIVDAFAAWSTPELFFDITFDSTPGTNEIDLFATDSRIDPLFQGNGFSGLAFTYRSNPAPRTLTSGSAGIGRVITRGEVFLAFDRLWQSFELWKLAGLLFEEDRFDRYVNLLIHEIGHTLGFGHPNENPDLNIDDDGDPFTVFEPDDPLNPWVGLSLSDNVDPDAIMRGGIPIVNFREAFTATELYADDRSGLNLLYPSVPEPPLAWLLGLALLGIRRSRRA